MTLFFPTGQISKPVVEYDNDILSKTTEGISIKLLSLSIKLKFGFNVGFLCFDVVYVLTNIY